MKKYLPDLLVIITLIIISFIYFFPANIEDRILFQHDTAAGAGAGQEVKEYYEKTGERSRWTNSLFGGMPTYQIAPTYSSSEPIKLIQSIYSLFLPPYVWHIFIMMLGFYLLLRCLKLPPSYAGLGSIAWGFSSYFFILIGAGHLWKLITLAYVPPTIAGIVLTFRKKYLWGGLITALFASLQLYSNHIQMSYYFFFLIVFLLIGFFVEAKKKNELTHFYKSLSIIFLAGVFSLAINSSNLYHTYQYSKETMRGGSELIDDNKSKGLDKAYITQWSYGVGETLNLLIPNYAGGASIPLSKNSEAMRKANPNYTGLFSQLSQYFGEQPMTAGPVYIGAFIIFLFIVALQVVKGPCKWALLTATIFSITLAWGKNFPLLTNFFIDYIPLYNKFRAVSSILVIAEFTIPLLAILGLKELLSNKLNSKNKKALFISFLLTAGLSLLIAVKPDLFYSSLHSSQELLMLQQSIPEEYLNSILYNLQEVRSVLVSRDAWRSLFIISIGGGLLYFGIKKRVTQKWILLSLSLLVLADLWSVNKRYLYDDMFVDSSIKKELFTKSKADITILDDNDPNFRVLNFATNTFNENNTSYWHKSIGGYHAAKLQRYQDLIDKYISNEMQSYVQSLNEFEGDVSKIDRTTTPILNMLNAKYFIIPTQSNEMLAFKNQNHQGNAWFVSEYVKVDSPNDELSSLQRINLTTQAVINKEYKIETPINQLDIKDSRILLTSYKPNELIYHSKSSKDGLVVFSEIYYPGWKVTIDDKPSELIRANYILRALEIPAGEHIIKMEFKPTTIKVTESLAWGALSLLLLGFIIALGCTFKKK